MQIETLDRRKLTEAEARPVAELLVKVFPRRPLEERLARFIGRWRDYDGPEEFYPRSMIIRDGERVVAHAAASAADDRHQRRGYDDRRACAGGDRSGVSRAEAGAGGGAGGVRAGGSWAVRHIRCFRRPHQVRPFYEKLGAGLVTNEIVNSLADDPNGESVLGRSRDAVPGGEALAGRGDRFARAGVLRGDREQVTEGRGGRNA